MKIALIITGLKMGGAERQVCDLADQVAAKGHQVLLISMTGETVNRPQSDAVDLIALNMSKTPTGLIKAYFRVRHLIKRFKPDVVHSHMVHANLFSRLLRLTIGIPRLICTAHSSNEGGRTRILAYRMTDHLCDVNTNVSQEAVDISIMRGAVPANRIIAMYNGIDTERFAFDSTNRNQLRSRLGLAEETPLILAVGRLTAAKDYPNLLGAFQKIISTGSHAQLAIIGTGEEQAKLVALVFKLGLDNRVHFLGLCRDIERWMSAADVFVLSSAWEGFGLVIAEAMACERVVVATDCGGVKEVIGKYGFLVPPKNSTLLANSISNALSMDNKRKTELGTLARKHIEKNFSLEKITEKWLSIYINS